MNDQLKNKIPQIRFPEFKEKWEVKKLGEIAKFSKGKGISKNDIVEDGNNYCIRYGELYTKYNEVIDIIYSKTNIDTSKLVFSEINDVIIPSSGETHIDIATASCVLSKGIILGGDLNIIKTKNNGVFLSYYFNNKKRIEIASLAQGSSVIHLYSNSLSTLNISIPTLPEQKKIAHFFTTIDQKINQLQEKKNALEGYKKGMMQQLFSQELQFKDENGKTFDDWEVKKLGEVCEINPKNKNLPNSFIYVDLESVEKGRLIKKNRMSIENSPSRAQRLLSHKDILFQMVRPYQKNNYFFDEKSKDYVASTGYAQIRTNHNPIFIYQLLHTQSFVNKVIVKCTGTGYPAINSTDLSKVIISLPSTREQTKIANFLTKIDKKINAVNTQIENTKTYKKGLLQKMFV